MVDIKQLTEKSNEFFDKHFDRNKLKLLKPTWKKWELEGTRPDNEKPGCYAMVFLKDGIEVIKYIGIGRSQTGVGSRINDYIAVAAKESDRTHYKPIIKLEQEGLIAFYIMGFEKEVSYLIPALEEFLIRELNPLMNIMGNSLDNY
jgi:hypothetical protein